MAALDVDGLFREHNERLVRQLQGVLGISEDDAREAAQFAWLKLIERPPSHIAGGGIPAWLFTVAKFELFARWRKGKREMPVDELHDRHQAGQVDVDEPPDRDAVRELLDTAWAEQLTPNQRLVLGLWAQGERYKTIAALTGHRYTWVNRHITEGMAALRKAIRDRP